MNSRQRRKFKRSKGRAMVILCESAGVEVPLKFRKYQRRRIEGPPEWYMHDGWPHPEEET